MVHNSMNSNIEGHVNLIDYNRHFSAQTTQKSLLVVKQQIICLCLMSLVESKILDMWCLLLAFRGYAVCQRS